MPLPQLVGLQCVICQKGIASIVAGTFCEACGNPVHRKCASARAAPANDDDAIRNGAPDYWPNDESKDSRCMKCGGDVKNDVAKEVQAERATSTVVPFGGRRTIGPRPPLIAVASKCPQCDGDKYTTVPSQRFLAWARDRVCDACGTQYSPPTPRRAGVIYVFVGFAAVVVTAVGSYVGATYGGGIYPLASIAGVVVGVTSIVLGVRSMIQPGKS